jgi:hypothetical protein
MLTLAGNLWSLTPMFPGWSTKKPCHIVFVFLR